MTAPPEHQPYYQPRHAVELPTHETPTGSRVGVGSLPGNNNEFGVARLPDERAIGNPYVHSQSTVVSAASSPFKSALRKADELPTREEPSGSGVGVGSLPGSTLEPGVATLPEERERMLSHQGATNTSDVYPNVHGMIQKHFEAGGEDRGSNSLSVHPRSLSLHRL